MLIKTNIEELIKLDPCKDFLEFAIDCNGDFKLIWETCPRGDWLIWILRKYKKLKKEMAVQLAISCAESFIKIYKEKYPNDDKPRKAIEAAKEWLKKPSKKAAAAAAYIAAILQAYTATAVDKAAGAAKAGEAYTSAIEAGAVYTLSYAVATTAARAEAASADATFDALSYAATAAYRVAYAVAKEVKKEQADIIRSIVKCPFADKKKDKCLKGGLEV